jgi:hypothetical protein
MWRIRNWTASSEYFDPSTATIILMDGLRSTDPGKRAARGKTRDAQRRARHVRGLDGQTGRGLHPRILSGRAVQR